MDNNSEGVTRKDKHNRQQPIVDNMKLSREEYIQKYNEVNKLIKDNNTDTKKDRKKDTLKDGFFVEWQKLE